MMHQGRPMGPQGQGPQGMPRFPNQNHWNPRQNGPRPMPNGPPGPPQRPMVRVNIRIYTYDYDFFQLCIPTIYCTNLHISTNEKMSKYTYSSIFSFVFGFQHSKYSSRILKIDVFCA